MRSRAAGRAVAALAGALRRGLRLAGCLGCGLALTSLPAQQPVPAPVPAAPVPAAPVPANPAPLAGQQQPDERTLPSVGPAAEARTQSTHGAGSPLPTLPGLPAIEAPQPAPAAPSPTIERVQASKVEPTRDRATGLGPSFLGFLGPYRRPRVPELFPGSGARLGGLIHDGRLFLSLHDALALTIENNLEVEVERYNLALAETDVTRAAGGGSTRGIDYTITETPPGVGGPGSPLLNSSQTGANPITPTIDDLTSLNSSTVAQTNLSGTGTQSYSPGGNLPYFDPSFLLEAGYLRRSNTSTIGNLGAATSTATQADTVHYVITNAAYLQGFSPGTQIEATVNNDSQVTFASQSQNDPFHAPSTSFTVTQPLLRGAGRTVNLRYLRIANLDRRISNLLFEQQLIETVYGTSRLYFDLVSLGENIAVQQEALRAARKLYEDDASQVELGTLAPIELTRAKALLSSSQFDLTQAQGLYRQEEVLLRNEIIRPGAPAFRAAFTSIVPTDRITVPDQLEPMNVEQLEAEGLANRPDLAQAHLQLASGAISTQASRNNALAQLNVYANFQTRGSSEQSYEPLGSPAANSGVVTVPQNFAIGGLRVGTIYQAGVQLTLPLRDRIAQADAARDSIELRQASARAVRLEDRIRADIENAAIALETAQSAYEAAVASTGYQEQLLDAERDKLALAQSTNLLVIQNEATLAQARSTEIAARSNWMKARIALDRALGNLLQKNNISLDDAIQGTSR